MNDFIGEKHPLGEEDNPMEGVGIDWSNGVMECWEKQKSVVRSQNKKNRNQEFDM